jgi:hypothetical protein
MRKLPWIALAFAACGGKSTGTGTTAPTNTTTSTTTTTSANVCANRPDEMGPVMLDATQAAGRYGINATHFSDVKSSQQQPVEVCGVGGEMSWLTAMKCADGSSAYKPGENPDDTRTGDTGAGGRCGSIIDLYPAKCPEATYQVYMDMYMCTDGESFM